MSKWSDEFIAQYRNTKTVKRLTQEIKDALNKKKIKKEVKIKKFNLKGGWN